MLPPAPTVRIRRLPLASPLIAAASCHALLTSFDRMESQDRPPSALNKIVLIPVATIPPLGAAATPVRIAVLPLSSDRHVAPPSAVPCLQSIGTGFQVLPQSADLRIVPNAPTA